MRTKRRTPTTTSKAPPVEDPTTTPNSQSSAARVACNLGVGEGVVVGPGSLGLHISGAAVPATVPKVEAGTLGRHMTLALTVVSGRGEGVAGARGRHIAGLPASISS